MGEYLERFWKGKYIYNGYKGPERKKKRHHLNPSKYYDIIFQESKMIPESTACLSPTSSPGYWRAMNTFSANQND